MLSRYYRELSHIHVNTLPPRAYFVPFESREKANGQREDSAFFTLLNGEWDFKWFANVEELELEAPDFCRTVVCDDKMSVPGHWQLKLDKGYDVPNYINQDYPYPVDPPFLPDEIPCGFYRKKIPFAKLSEKSYTLTFEGVSAGFYVWLNGCFVGYSQASHNTSEFDISESLTDGENTLEVLVIKHTTGSYMEDQDFFRLSGIFRDVYILTRDVAHICDIDVKIAVADDFLQANVSTEITCSQELTFDYALINPEGKQIVSGQAGGGFAFDIHAPQLWNPEAPVLYTLILHSGSEYIALPIGFKHSVIQNGVYLLNGKKVKCKGINRHDTNPETGYAVSMQDMLTDLKMLKKAHVNTIRTSHYPNDPRFLRLCDELGFMLVDEADLETHGMGYNYGDWYWDYWAHICDVPEWENACIDRIERLYERDKNHVCVIMWSLGNESGCGENHRKMANWLRARNPFVIVHYENARLEYGNRLHKDFSDISDVESRMYADLGYLKEYLEDPAMTKPFFYCEYVSAWSTGDIPLHWRDFEQYDNYMGGCVWEFADHAVNIGTKENPKYRFGGDFGDIPNDYIYCVDGVVYPNRTPRPGYYDMLQCYSPLMATYENGVLTLINKNFYTDLSDFSAKVYYEVNGEKREEQAVDLADMLPGGCKTVLLSAPPQGESVTLNVELNHLRDTWFSEKGEWAGHIQFIVKNAPIALTGNQESKINATQSFKDITVQIGDVQYVFSKIYGTVTGIRKNGELLKEPMAFCMSRAYLPNCANCGDWERARYAQVKQKTYSVTLDEQTSERVVIKALVSFAAPAMPPAVKAQVTYTFEANGKMNVAVQADVTHNAPPLPRFGIKLVTDDSFCNIQYVGYGPFETYCDRYSAAKLSKYTTTVDKNFEPHIKPTEGSAHYATKIALVQNQAGNCIAIADTGEKGFSFNAVAFTDEQLHKTRHADELIKTGITVIHADYRLNGENTANADRENGRIFDEKHFSFSFDFYFG